MLQSNYAEALKEIDQAVIDMEVSMPTACR